MIQTHSRDLLVNHLTTNSIETKIQHPLLMSQQTPYKSCISSSKNALKIVPTILCLPIHHKMSDSDAYYVASVVKKFYN